MAALIIGVFGGLLGSAFIIINNKVNIIRKKILNTKWKKVLESCLLVTLTVSTFYLCSWARNRCLQRNEVDAIVQKGHVK